jgi:predicted nucleic acid-binding protein
MIFIPANEDRALLDACVLAPMPLCDTLLRCAVEPSLYRPLWSDLILGEVGAALERMGYSPRQRERRLQTMADYFPEAKVEYPSQLAPTLLCIPDEQDRHVLAAAIYGHADRIVTFNEKHFPEECLGQYGILRQHPDDFLVRKFHSGPVEVMEKIDSQAMAIRQPRESIVSRLRDLGQAPKFAALLSEKF